MLQSAHQYVEQHHFADGHSTHDCCCSNANASLHKKQTEPVLSLSLYNLHFIFSSSASPQSGFYANAKSSHAVDTSLLLIFRSHDLVLFFALVLFTSRGHEIVSLIFRGPQAGVLSFRYTFFFILNVVSTGL